MRKKVNKKLIVALLSFVLLFGGTFGSSLAWLLDKTDNVQNTFTTSDINITLTETDATVDNTTGNTSKEFQMIPGCTVTKDPKVTVLANSVDCWVFVEVIESETLDDYISYELGDKWESLGEDYPNIYYYEDYVHMDTTSAQEFAILKDDKVLTLGTVTKEMMDALDEGEVEEPTLTFKAYASQYMKDNNNNFTAEEAWLNVRPNDSGSEDPTNP